MPTVPSGSTKKSVPNPPDQPMRPRCGPSVLMATPKPHPMPSQNPGKKLSAVLHAAGTWSLVICCRCDLHESLVAEPVRCRRPVQLAFRHRIEREAHHPRVEDAEHGKRMMVAPSFTRLECQRNWLAAPASDPWSLAILGR